MSKAKGSPFRHLSFDQDLELTYESLKHIADDRNRGGRKTKWLNVLHGLNDHAGSEAAWYARVKEFDVNGGVKTSHVAAQKSTTSGQLERAMETG